ncbi:MAG: hypothetical protein N2C14_06620, partial [Planctomycetales bacterium]
SDTAQLAKTTADKSQAEAAGAQAALVAAQKTAADAVATLNAAKGKQTAQAKELEVAAQLAATIQAVLTPLAEAQAKTQEAATKGGNDPALLAAAESIKKLMTAKNVELEAARKVAAARKAALDVTVNEVAAAEKLSVAAAAEATAASKLVLEKSAAVKTTIAQATVAEKTLSDLAPALNAAQQAVDQIREQIFAARTIPAPAAEKAVSQATP